jgi:hypothetical protein
VQERVTKLERFESDTRERLARIETRLDTCATKEDLHRALHGMTWKLLGGSSALLMVVFWLAKNIH